MNVALLDIGRARLSCKSLIYQYVFATRGRGSGQTGYGFVPPLLWLQVRTDRAIVSVAGMVERGQGYGVDRGPGGRSPLATT